MSGEPTAIEQQMARMEETIKTLTEKHEESSTQIEKLTADNEKLRSSLEAVKDLIPSDSPVKEEGCNINTFEIEMKGKGGKIETVKFAVREAYKKANSVYVPGIGFQPLDKTIKAYQQKENEQLIQAIAQFDEQGYEFAPFEKSK